jgi:hypothetical protein
MDIIVREIVTSEEDKMIEFDKTKNRIIRFLKTRYLILNRNLKKKNKMETSVNMNINTNMTIDLVKVAYINLFGEPENNIYDEKKLKVIKKHLKQKNLI